MGVFTDVKIQAPLTCCAFVSEQWQSKKLTVRVAGKLMELKHKCSSIGSIEGIVSGEIHDWCPRCKKMSYYRIENGVLHNSDEKENHRIIDYD